MMQQKKPEAAAPVGVDPILRNFPLVCRPRLTCPDLGTRIAEARAHALAAQQQNEPADQLNRACAAMNLAALIAADCGMPTLARDLCQRQFQIFRPAWPLSGPTAVAALQPLVNLTRLVHRAGDPHRAYAALRAMDAAVRDRRSTRINGAGTCLGGLVATAADQSHVTRWLRVLLLQDGTRLLAATGQWGRAAAHAAHYDDAPDYLAEGRQAEVIARFLDDRGDAALELLDTSTISEPWHAAVATCLRCCIILHTGRPAAGVLRMALAAVEAFRDSTDLDTAVFRIRLGLTVAALIAPEYPAQADLAYAALIRDAEQSQDAFAARAVLSHRACRRRMRPADAAALAGLVRKAGLGLGFIPQPLLNGLMTAVEEAEALLAQSLDLV